MLLEQKRITEVAEYTKKLNMQINDKQRKEMLPRREKNNSEKVKKKINKNKHIKDELSVIFASLCNELKIISTFFFVCCFPTNSRSFLDGVRCDPKNESLDFVL